jgi:iron complex transport system ATP-binding protein
VVVPDGRNMMIVGLGSNACGKSTLLRGLARLLRPRNGAVLLDGVSLDDMRSVDVARTLGLLPQTPVAPNGITVGDLVARGRYPHQGWFRRWSTGDAGAVAEALEATGIADLVDRGIDELSGGQRQRVWVAMALAQDTDLLLLDEPTTFLDISHQVDLLDLLTDLNRNAGRTIVIVLHASTSPAATATTDRHEERGDRVAGTARRGRHLGARRRRVRARCEIVTDPVSGTPMVVPRGRHHPGAIRSNGTGAAGHR